MTHDPLTQALHGARVPRYTSYPPADRFTPAVGPKDTHAWLAQIDPAAPVSLYIHVPFCRRLCWFCACRTQGTQNNTPIDRYLTHLQQEIAMVADLLPAGVTVGQLHLGGGTPTILSPDRIAALASTLRRSFRFNESAEISVEIDPCDCDGDRLEALVSLGMNRVSLGVQDFAPEVQAAIGRIQSLDATEAVVTGARARGLQSINVDLIYGLPFQTIATLTDTLNTVIGFRPDRLALYGYAHVPWMAKRQRMIPQEALPDPAQRLGLAAHAREMLIEAGYRPVGIDHFALPHDTMAIAAADGTLRRNFQGYTTDSAMALIGLGPSAISSFPQGITQNCPATGAWQERIARRTLATHRGHVLSPTDKTAAAIIAQLMCHGRVALDDIAVLSDSDPTTLRTRAEQAIVALPGIGTLDGFTLTAANPATVRLLCTYFDPGLDRQKDKYSLAS